MRWIVPSMVITASELNVICIAMEAKRPSLRRASSAAPNPKAAKKMKKLPAFAAHLAAS